MNRRSFSADRLSHAYARPDTPQSPLMSPDSSEDDTPFGVIPNGHAHQYAAHQPHRHQRYLEATSSGLYKPSRSSSYQHSPAADRPQLPPRRSLANLATAPSKLGAPSRPQVLAGCGCEAGKPSLPAVESHLPQFQPRPDESVEGNKAKINSLQPAYGHASCSVQPNMLGDLGAWAAGCCKAAGQNYSHQDNVGLSVQQMHAWVAVRKYPAFRTGSQEEIAWEARRWSGAQAGTSGQPHHGQNGWTGSSQLRWRREADASSSIVSLLPSGTEILYALGLGDR